MKNELEIFIPVSIELDWPTAQDVIECIKEQHGRYGFSKFLLACPGAGWRSKGYPPRAELDRLAAQRESYAPVALGRI